MCQLFIFKVNYFRLKAHMLMDDSTGLLLSGVDYYPCPLTLRGVNPILYQSFHMKSLLDYLISDQYWPFQCCE